MGSKKLRELSQKYLQEYIEHFNLNINEKRDLEELIKAIFTLECQECEEFFHRHQIDITEYPRFKEILQKEVMLSLTKNQKIDQYIDLSKKNQKISNISNTNKKNFDTIINNILNNLKWNTLNESKKSKIYFEICNMSLTSIQNLIQNSSEIVLNEEDSKLIVKELLRILEKESKINLLSLGTISNESSKEMELYQKMILAFQKLDYDHLSEEEKNNLVKNILEDRVLTKMDLQELNLSDEDYLKIKESIINKLPHNQKESLIKDFIEKYVNLFKKADSSFLENFLKNFQISNIRNKHPELFQVSDVELKNIMNSIIKKGRKITIQKILTEKNLKEFFEKFTQKTKNINLEEYKALKETLQKFSKSNEMLGLSNFNKALLVEELDQQLEESKTTLKNSSKNSNNSTNKNNYKDTVSAWKEMLLKFTYEELLDFYEKLKDCKKSFLACENFSDEEFQKAKNEVEKIIEKELAIHILMDQNLNEIQDLDKFEEKIKQWTHKDFYKYNLSKDLYEKIRIGILNEINEEKVRRKNRINPKLTKKIEGWKKILLKFTHEELLDFYEKLKDCKKEFLACKDFSDEEFQNIKIEVEKLVEKELANRILMEQNFNEVEDLDELRKNIENWNQEDFKDYNIPNEIHENVKEEMINEIQEEKLRRNPEERYFDIGAKVILNKEVPVYDNEKGFSYEFVSRKEKIKNKQKGKVSGYVIRKENDIKVINNKKDLNKSLKKGYEVIGYNFDYRNGLKKQSSYVKVDDITSKSKLNRFTKKLLFMLAGLSIVGMLSYNYGMSLTKNQTKGNKKEINNQLSDDTNVPEELNKSDEDLVSSVNDKLRETFKDIPDLNVTFQTPESMDNEKIIYNNVYEIGTDNGQTAYYKSDTKKEIDGIVLESPDGIRKVYQDTDEIINLLSNHGYKYIGVRVTNEHSFQNGTKEYEGFYGEDSIELTEAEATLSRKL